MNTRAVAVTSLILLAGCCGGGSTAPVTQLPAQRAPARQIVVN